MVTDPRTRHQGFTLIEVVIAMAITVSVLAASYKILVNILDTERHVARMSTPEKVGQGILSILRRDLLGVIYRHLGERVFQVYDEGEGIDARDRLEYFTTRRPIMPENLGGQLEGGGTDALGEGAIQSITAVSWFVQQTPGAVEASIFTLFRQENVGGQGADPFLPGSGGAIAYEVYDKMRSFSIECFNGYEWLPVWDSASQLQAEADELADLAEESVASGGSSVTAPVRGATAGAGSTSVEEEGEFDDLGSSEQLLPPAAVPVAVKIDITILAGDEKGAYTDEKGYGAFKEYTYSTIVPILTSMRIPLSSDDELSSLQDMEGIDMEAIQDAAGGAGASGNIPQDLIDQFLRGSGGGR